MRRRISLTLFAFACLLLVVVTMPDHPRPEPPIVQPSGTPIVSWSVLESAMKAQSDWYAAQATRPIVVSLPRRQSGTVTAAATDANPGSIELLILDVFGSAGPSAVRVARCESRLIPTARNGQFRGLFQIGAMHAQRWADVTGTDYFSSWMDPQLNAEVAYSLWQEAGWGPWECKP